MKKYTGYFLAGIVGILFIIGLRGASAASPTDLPSSNVTPTFSGLSVTGDTGLYVKKTAQANDVNVNNGLTVLGIATLNGDTYAGGNFNINDEFYTGSDIAGITPTKGYYTILDRLLAYGAAVFKGNTTFQSDVSVKGGLTVDGNAKATGKLSTGGDLTADGKLGIVGDAILGGKLNLKGILENTADTLKVYDATGALKEQITPAPVYVDDNMKVWGNLTSKGAFEAQGKALFSGATEFSKTLLVPGGIENSAGDVLINDALDVRQGIFNNDGTSLVKLGSGSKPMNLQVTGTIKAGSIGTYNYPSSKVVVKDAISGIASAYCAKSTDVLLGCYYSASDKDMKIYALDKTISGGLKGCYANFNNPTAAIRTVTVSGVCFGSTY